MLAPLVLAALSPLATPNVSSTGGTLIVLNKSEATASLIDAASGETRATVPTGAGPHEVAVSPDGRLAVVCDYGEQTPGSTLTVIDLETSEVAETLSLGRYARPHGIVFLGESGRMLVTAEQDKALIEVDLATGEVLRAMKTDQDASHMVAADPAGKRAFVANIGSGSITAIDLESGERIANVPTGAGCEGVDVSPDGKFVWASNRAADTVTVLDAVSLEVVAELECPGFPIRVKLTPDGSRALVSCARSGVVAVYDAREHELIERVAMSLEAAEGSEEHLFRDAFGSSPVPIGIQVRPDGKLAYVANSNANRIAVLDLETLKVTGAWEAGQQPDGLGWAPE